VTFAAYETSQELAQPIELYEFKQGTETFYYTSNEADVTFASQVYAAVALKREATKQLVDATQEGMNLTVPSNLTFIRRFILVTPGKRVSLILRRFHRNDPDLQAVVLFRGVVQSFRFGRDGREAILQVAPATVAYSRNIPRFTFQSLCNHMLYDARCKLNESDPAFSKLLPVTAVVGSVVTATGAGAFGADFFVAGFAEMDQDFRAIVSQSTDDLELIAPFSTSPVGTTIRFVAGCKHRLVEDCEGKFNNVSNYGGYPYVPTKNPFSTGLD